MMVSKHLDQLQKKLRSTPSTPGIFTGIASLDKVIGGLRSGCLYLICGDRQVGKTAFAAQMVNSIVMIEKECHGVALFSLDLLGDQMTERLLSNLSGVGIREITLGQLSKYQLEVILEEARVRLERSLLYIDDSAMLDHRRVVDRIYLFYVCQQVDVVFIDKLKVLDNPNETCSAAEVSQFMKELKDIALKLNISIVLLADYDEHVEGEPKIPQLHDLSEQRLDVESADVVLYLYRPEYYQKEWGETDLIVLKNDSGFLGTIKLIADLSTQKFKEQLL